MTFLFETVMEVHTSELYSSLEIQPPFSSGKRRGYVRPYKDVVRFFNILAKIKVKP